MSVIRWPEKMNVGGRLAESTKMQAIGALKVCDPKNDCPQTLHVNLFFDGTNNNMDWDTRDAERPTHTNVARLFRGCADTLALGQYKYYIPGVGTPFREIGETKFTSEGKAMAKGFGMRVAWGYTSLLDAVHRALTNRPLLGYMDARSLCEALLSTRLAYVGLAGSQLDKLHREIATEQSKNEKPGGRREKLIKQVWINVFGFSRGAAEVRVFANKLINTWAKDGLIAGKIPYKVNFLGLFDTVASVGIPDTATAIAKVKDMDSLDGHWALSSGGALNVPAAVRRCVHFFSIHEQRMSFPLDTVREGNAYPGGEVNRIEVAYPGVHSDVGGGYCIHDQGKARGGEGDKLSQITLHDMYIEALTAGVPLILEDEIRRQTRLVHDFALLPSVANAFNAWLATVNSKPLDRVETALRIGMGESLAWRTLRADIGNPSFYVTNQAFYREAKEDPLTPYAVESKVAARGAGSPASKLAALQDERAGLARRSAAMRTAAVVAKASSGLSSSSVFDKQVKVLDAQIEQKDKAIIELVANKPGRLRPGEGSADITTNDKTDLLESAEEFRLLLAYLRPEQRTRWSVQWTEAPSVYKMQVSSPLHPEPQSKGYFLTVSRGSVPGHARQGSHQVRLIKYETWLQAVSLKAAYDVAFDFVLAPSPQMLPFLLEHTSDDAVRKLPAAVVKLFDDYLHDSRAWFRVPRFHEYSVGGYGWPRMFFVGKDTRVRYLGLTESGASAAQARENQSSRDLGAFIASMPPPSYIPGPDSIDMNRLMNSFPR